MGTFKLRAKSEALVDWMDAYNLIKTVWHTMASIVFVEDVERRKIAPGQCKN